MTRDQKWNKLAAELLQGRTIKAVSYMSPTEAESAGFEQRPVAIELDNGLLFFPQMDDEGNDAGALVCFDPTTEKETILPTLSRRS